MNLQTVYVPVKASEKMPAENEVIFTNVDNGYELHPCALKYRHGDWYERLYPKDVLQIPKDKIQWLEPTEAILISKEDAEKIKDILNRAKSSLQYAAFNYDETTEVDDKIIESTGVSETALISAREITQALQILNK